MAITLTTPSPSAAPATPADPSSKRVTIIGAGPSGLTCLKELREQGLDAQCYEALPFLGGVFAAHYEQLQLVSSSLVTAFGAHSDGREAQPQMWTRDAYLVYLMDYAQRFDLLRHIHFGVRVTSVEPSSASQGYRVRVEPIAPDAAFAHAHRPQPAALAACQQQANKLSEPTLIEADHVVVCSGVHLTPSQPHWPGQGGFPGRILHARDYWNADEFAGQRVLLVGLGESGSDLALQVAKQARATHLSSRRGPGYVLPRFHGGRPSDLDTNRMHHAIPRSLIGAPIVRLKTRLEAWYSGPQDDHAVLEMAQRFNQARGYSPFHRFSTKNTSFIEAILRHGAALHPDIARIDGERVHFVDGSHCDCDVILHCTGYQVDFPFLAPPLREAVVQAGSVRQLYKRMLHPELGLGVSWVGFVRPGLGAIPPMAEMQARYLALLLSGQQALPSRDAMRDDIRREALDDARQFPEDHGRVVALTDFLRFMESLASVIGCRPPLSRLAWRHPRAWLKLLYAPLCGAQYRLTGPGAQPEQALATLARMPTMPWPVLAWETLCVLLSRLLWGLGFGESFQPLGLGPRPAGKPTPEPISPRP